MTDQQRFDSIAALGSYWMHTPNLDRLVNEGISFSNCFVNSPVCVTSRASLFAGKHPHNTGVFHNFQTWQPSWVSNMADVGYHCVNIGKMHINPYHEMGGFHQRFVVENKDRPLFLNEHKRAFYDEWDKALKSHGIDKPSRYNRHIADPEGYQQALGCFPWQHDEQLHSDMFVGNTVNWWLKDRLSDAPLFLQIGFPGPHPPYDPSPAFLEMYADTDIPLPEVTADQLQRQPQAQKDLRQNMIDYNFDSVQWQHMPDPEGILKIRRHYAANVSMIDHKVGEILSILEQQGELDNTLIVFTSDHADALGDHGHIQKWTMYDTVLRVPLIFWSPGMIKRQQIIDTPIELMALAPTLLDVANIEVPIDFDATSLWPCLRHNDELNEDGVVYAELARDHIQTGAQFIVMRRDQDWKIVWYAGAEDGELYNIKADPDELNNLWLEPTYQQIRDELVAAIQQRTLMGFINAQKKSLPTPQQPMKI